MELKIEKSKEIFSKIIKNVFGFSTSYICHFTFNNHYSIGILCSVYVIDFKKYYSILLTSFQSFEYSEIDDKTIEINFHNINWKPILIDESRIKYTSLEYGIAFFQIKDTDNLDKTKFLKLDYEIINKNKKLIEETVNISSEEFILGLTNSFEDILVKDKNYSKLFLSRYQTINLIKNNLKGIYEGRPSANQKKTIKSLIESIYIRFSDKIRDLIEFKKEFNSNEKNNKSINKSMDSYGKKLAKIYLILMIIRILIIINQLFIQ